MATPMPEHFQLPHVQAPETDLTREVGLPVRTWFRCQCGYEVIAPDPAEGAAAIDEHLTGMGWATRALLADDPE